MTTPNLAATPLLAALLLLPPVAAAQQGPAVPDGVRHRAVDIWSEGTRMAGDLYRPADIGDDPAPAIIMSHGWGGTKAGLVRNAIRFAADGFVVLAFDYRGWGESDGKLVVIGDMPERDVNGEMQVLAREIRRVVDSHRSDPRHPAGVRFPGRRVGRRRRPHRLLGLELLGRPCRLGRSQRAAGRLRGRASRRRRLARPRAHVVEGHRHRHRTVRAGAGDPPRPRRDRAAPAGHRQGAQPERLGASRQGHRVPARSTTPAASTSRYWSSTPNTRNCSTRHRAGELAVARAKANGARAEYHVIPDITHYDIYREAFEESGEMAREWFNGCLKD